MICVPKLEAVEYVAGLPALDLVDGARIVDSADRYGRKEVRFEGGTVTITLCREPDHQHGGRAFRIECSDT